MRLGSFNKLPARPEYIVKVRKCLGEKNGRSIHSIVKSTGLTKTQTICAVEAMIAKNEVVMEDGTPRRFYLKES